jgi:hypothetical protein
MRDSLTDIAHPDEGRFDGADRAIAPAIKACYDTAFEFGRWPQALQQLANSIGVTSCVIRTLDQAHPFRLDSSPRRWLAGLRLLALLMLMGAFAAKPGMAEPRRLTVDLELVLAVDVSSSISMAEQRVQRDGYISAFRHPDVVRAIKSGPHGMIAVSYMEWAGPGYQRVVLPWVVIGNDDEAMRFADALAIQPFEREAGTSISTGLLRAEDLLARSWFAGERHVIDVSGDGPNNAGPPVVPVRDRLVASGITINGLPVSLPRDGPDEFESFGPNYLSSYFEYCVIGGLDAFVIGIDDLSRFEIAIRRKLVREITDLSFRPKLAYSAARRDPAFDCATRGQATGR